MISDYHSFSTIHGLPFEMVKFLSDALPEVDQRVSLFHR
jgi:hypothetical protein